MTLGPPFDSIPVYHSPYLKPGQFMIGSFGLVSATYDRPWDALLAEVRVEAGTIVREGMADVLAWLGPNAPVPHHFGDLLMLGGVRFDSQRVVKVTLPSPRE